MDSLTIIQPDDWHLHLRDGEALAAVVDAGAGQFGRAIVMPNLKPPITTVALAQAYRRRILDALARGQSGDLSRRPSLVPLMTLYLTEATTVTEVAAAKASGIIHGIKLYPAGATTNSDAGVGSVERVYPVLAAMERAELPLLVHGEVVDPAVDVFDREAVFIERVLEPLRRRMPGLRVVFEHITTRDAADYVREADAPGMTLGATITPQHLVYNRNAIFTGGLRPHWYCLPVLKRETHRQALVAAATGDCPRFFLGTDSAPHARVLKEHASGCAGCYTAPHALALYAAAFDAAGALDRLEAFASRNGPAFYRLPVNEATVTLERRPWTVPESLPFGNGEIVPLGGGETLPWQVVASTTGVID
ncbi:MAG TPA: dihydroorotase [Lautropia sp.]|nr:dihydroorotase [Lautropia sp.]